MNWSRFLFGFKSVHYVQFLDQWPAAGDHLAQVSTVQDRLQVSYFDSTGAYRSLWHL